MLAVGREEVLPVGTGGERGVAHAGSHVVAVGQRTSLDACQRDERRVSHLGTEGRQPQRGSEGVERVEVVAQREVPHREGHALGGALFVLHACAVGERLAVDAHLGVLHLLVLEQGVARSRQLALLGREEHAATGALGAHAGTNGARQTVERLSASGTATRLLVQDEVEHAHGALGIVARTGIGDDFNLFHRSGRHHLQHLRGVLREHGVGLAVYVHLESRRAVDGDVVLAVHGDHRHLAQHVEHGR